MRAGTEELAAIFYLFTQTLTELASTACCISEDDSVSAGLNPQADGVITCLQNVLVSTQVCNLHILSYIFINVFLLFCLITKSVNTQRHYDVGHDLGTI